ncbi:hypothetical protein [Streptomyces nigra]|uniref:hypothetical protein n=1 Tax=Streptomyces nigra TaxID=1827580 RepID=UPI00362CD790
MKRCRFCPRRLSTTESLARGYGLICGRKHGLIPPTTPRHRRTQTQVAPVMTPNVHPDQTAIPIQPTLPEEA